MRLVGVDKTTLNSVQEIVLGGASRGIDTIQTPRSFSLGRLARSILKRPPESSISLLTGFPIVAEDGSVKVENDGPIGVGHLAMAFSALGWRYRLVSDTVAADVLQAITQVVARHAGTPGGEQTILMPQSADAAERQRIVDKLKADATSHLIAIERPGRAEDGQAYNMRGQSIDDHIALTEFLFDDQPWKTAAFADGGNEIGIGNIGYRRISQSVHLGRKIASRTKVDFLTLCGVSNWGAYGLIALLAIYAPKLKPALLENFTTAFDQELFEAVQEAGGVDGVTKAPTATVDGIDLALNQEKIPALRKLVEATSTT